MSDLRARELFDPAVREWIHSSVDQRPVVLIAPVGAGAEDLAVAELEQAGDRVMLAPTVGVGIEELVTSTVTQLIDGIEPAGAEALTRNTESARNARIELARRYGANATEALEIAQGRPPEGWTLADAIGAPTGSPTLVAVSNAHRLPQPLLWELRDLTNNDVTRAILTSHREHQDRLTGPRAPLHGNATIIELLPPDARAWAQQLPETPLAELEWLLTRTRARAASTLEVISHLAYAGSVDSAWQQALSARESEAESVLNLASGLHPYGPALLRAIAHGHPPYAAIPDAPSQRVARALAKLRDMDLIEQPLPRNWQIADPILQGALRARTGEPNSSRGDLEAAHGRQVVFR